MVSTPPSLNFELLVLSVPIGNLYEHYLTEEASIYCGSIQGSVAFASLHIWHVPIKGVCILPLADPLIKCLHDELHAFMIFRLRVQSHPVFLFQIYMTAMKYKFNYLCLIYKNCAYHLRTSPLPSMTDGATTPPSPMVVKPLVNFNVLIVIGEENESRSN